MDDETRRAVDEACLNILGWTELEWVTRELDWEKPYWRGRNGLMWGEAGSPSKRDRFIGPLLNTLRAKGWHIRISGHEGGWNVHLDRGGNICSAPGSVCANGHADSFPEALAMAAAKAMDERSEGQE